MYLASLVAILPLLWAQPRTEYKIVTTPTKRIEAVETCAWTAPKLKARMWIVMTPHPPTLPGQSETSVNILPGGAKVLAELSPRKRPIVEARIPVRDGKLQSGITIQVTYRASLKSRKLVSVKPGEKKVKIPALSKKLRDQYLQSVSLLDYRAESFQKWLKAHKLFRKSAEGDIAFAKRVYDHLRMAYRYKYIPAQNRHASYLCEKDATDCGGYSALFAAALRANGIPCRCLIGRWAISAKKKGDTHQAHVRTEFFAKGVGWVPVDPSVGLFGVDRGNFLTLHEDFGLIYDTKALGQKTLPWVQLVHAWATGSGSFAGSSTKFEWTVRILFR